MFVHLRTSSNYWLNGQLIINLTLTNLFSFISWETIKAKKGVN